MTFSGEMAKGTMVAIGMGLNFELAHMLFEQKKPKEQLQSRQHVVEFSPISQALLPHRLVSRNPSVLGLKTCTVVQELL